MNKEEIKEYTEKYCTMCRDAITGDCVIEDKNNEDEMDIELTIKNCIRRKLFTKW